eukprot:TRINITY_DN20582_c0_g1_i1.p2 TRINITY_DN20582_c0_g1~~TRINITY_DN20582_c0_g1_i1.p2  ORF type:complete len:191 (+),score=35.06 TRINITY_DN20582_c0_g1_i1:252-824(+)
MWNCIAKLVQSHISLKVRLRMSVDLEERIEVRKVKERMSFQKAFAELQSRLANIEADNKRTNEKLRDLHDKFNKQGNVSSKEKDPPIVPFPISIKDKPLQSDASQQQMSTQYEEVKTEDILDLLIAQKSNQPRIQNRNKLAVKIEDRQNLCNKSEKEYSQLQPTTESNEVPKSIKHKKVCLLYTSDAADE